MGALYRGPNGEVGDLDPDEIGPARAAGWQPVMASSHGGAQTRATPPYMKSLLDKTAGALPFARQITPAIETGLNYLGAGPKPAGSVGDTYKRNAARWDSTLQTDSQAHPTTDYLGPLLSAAAMPGLGGALLPKVATGAALPVADTVARGSLLAASQSRGNSLGEVAKDTAAAAPFAALATPQIPNAQRLAPRSMQPGTLADRFERKGATQFSKSLGLDKTGVDELQTRVGGVENAGRFLRDAKHPVTGKPLVGYTSQPDEIRDGLRMVREQVTEPAIDNTISAVDLTKPNAFPMEDVLGPFVRKRAAAGHGQAPATDYEQFLKKTIPAPPRDEQLADIRGNLVEEGARSRSRVESANRLDQKLYEGQRAQAKDVNTADASRFTGEVNAVASADQERFARERAQRAAEYERWARDLAESKSEAEAANAAEQSRYQTQIGDARSTFQGHPTDPADFRPDPVGGLPPPRPPWAVDDRALERGFGIKAPKTRDLPQPPSSPLEFMWKNGPTPPAPKSSVELASDYGIKPVKLKAPLPQEPTPSPLPDPYAHVQRFDALPAAEQDAFLKKPEVVKTPTTSLRRAHEAQAQIRRDVEDTTSRLQLPRGRKAIENNPDLNALDQTRSQLKGKMNEVVGDVLGEDAARNYVNAKGQNRKASTLESIAAESAKRDVANSSNPIVNAMPWIGRYGAFGVGGAGLTALAGGPAIVGGVAGIAGAGAAHRYGHPMAARLLSGTANALDRAPEMNLRVPALVANGADAGRDTPENLRQRLFLRYFGGE